jgi:hypothetical protein
MGVVARLPQFVALTVVAAAGYLALPAIGSHRDIPVLNAVVGHNDTYTIGLFFPDGKRVTTLPAGTYTVVVHDESAIHDFHLASNTDPTVNFRTDVPFVGDQLPGRRPHHDDDDDHERATDSAGERFRCGPGKGSPAERARGARAHGRS